MDNAGSVVTFMTCQIRHAGGHSEPATSVHLPRERERKQYGDWISVVNEEDAKTVVG